jgi:putative DNA primase/helicase
VSATEARQRAAEVRIPVNVEGIHDELLLYNSWVLWRYEERGDGKLTKVPYSPSVLRRASATDSRTWGEFFRAKVVYESGSCDGVGFVLSSGDPFTGIDFDDVRDPETGEIEGWAREAIDLLDGYTEISPTGRGVHVFVKGRVAARKGSQIEVYSERRFFTVTGVAP